MKGSDLCVDSSVWWRKVAKFHRFAKCKLCWLHTFCEVVNGINGLCGSASLLTRNHALEESEDKPCWGVEEMNEAACIQTCQVFNENPCSQRVWSVWLSKEFRQSSSNIFLKAVFLLFLSGEKKNEKETSFPICFVKNCSIFCVSFWPVFFMLFLHFFNFCNFFSLKKLHFFPKHFPLSAFFSYKTFSLFFTLHLFFSQLLLDFKARVSGPPLLMVAPWPQRPTSSHRAPPRSEWNTRRVLRFLFLYKKFKINWKEWWFHVEIKICHIIILILSFYLYIIFPSIISIYFVYFFAFFSIFSDTVIQEKWGKTSH